MRFAFLALLFLPSIAVAANCTPTPRMPESQSETIKRSLLPAGHSLSEYELDHIMPLCLGGSNDRSNLQMQLWLEAHLKDKVEWALCHAVRDGGMTCDKAQATMREWKAPPSSLPELETD